MQSSNFEFLRSEWPELADLGSYADQYMHSDPSSACVKSRILAEQIAIMTCGKFRISITSDNFLSLLQELESTKLLPRAVLDTFHAVRMTGNKGAHTSLNTKETARKTVQASFNLARWWMGMSTGSMDGIPKQFNEIKPSSPPNIQQELAEYDKLKTLNEQLIKENEALLKVQKERDTSNDENFKASAEQSANNLAFNEQETRTYLIDTMLMAAGWDVDKADDVAKEVELSGQATETGIGYADYVLYADDGKALAVIEAKRTSIDPEQGKKQAQGYADALQAQNKNIRPLIILTNGYETYLFDDKGGPKSLGATGYPKRRIYGFPSKESLEYRVRYQRSEMQDPQTIQPRSDIAGRPYQLEALKSVTERFGEQYRRKALLVQATGTGKTRVAISLADILMRAKYAKRILFLCDRRALRKQAKNAFTQFMPDRNITVLGRAKDPSAEVVLATYPAMMQHFQKYDVAWFDLIIADESHRSIYNKYRDLFIYFDALQVGLTATPREIVSHNTYDMFNCGEGDPTYYYEYERAVQEGYLVSYVPVSVTTKFLREGLEGGNLSKDDIKQLERDGIDVEIHVEPYAINSQAYIKGTNQAILRNLMENGLQDASQNGPGKSIIFARNHDHAQLLGEWFQEMYPAYGPDYCAVIDTYNPRAEQLIDDFKTPNANPIIAISVDMLDTGIDVPEVLNLVFAKPVRSVVKFWQMLGRGTRLCENLHGLGENKKEFCIFDHWGNIEFFIDHPEFEEVAPTASLLERLFEARIVLAETSLKKLSNTSFDRTIPLVRSMLNALPEDSLPVKEKIRIKKMVLEGQVLEHFAAPIIATIRHDLKPLMRYINIRGDQKAYQFDNLLTELQTEILLESAKVETLRGHVENKLASLQTNIDAVRVLFDAIKEMQSPTFWEQEQPALLAAIEVKRQELRKIMQYCFEEGRDPFARSILNIDDSDVQIKYLDTIRRSSQEMNAYRKRVRDVLEPHFHTNPTLKKLRNGEPLQEKDFDVLVSLVLTQKADIDLAILREFYPTAASLEKELRAIIGLDAAHVAEHFASFFTRHTQLSSMQMAFLNLLQRHIQEFGSIRIELLYEAPFTNMNAEGPEGIFTNDKQLQDLFTLIDTFVDTKAASYASSH